MTNPIGYLVLTSTPPEQIGSISTLVEDLGYGELWVAEDYFAYDGFIASEVALSATSNITVGLGIVSGVVRHPAVTAMAIASIARSHPGRFKAGIGHGATFWTNQMGLTPKSPLTSMTETVTAVRALLAGETYSSEGRCFSFREVALSHLPTERVPLLTGVVGPKSLELSGRIADGTIVSALAGPTYLAQAVESIARGVTAGGEGVHETPTIALASIRDNDDEARAAIRPVLAFYLMAMNGTALTYAISAGDEISRLLEKGGLETLAAEMPEEWIDELTVTGSPDHVEKSIRRLLEAGSSSVILTFAPETAESELRLFAETVLPRFESGE